MKYKATIPGTENVLIGTEWEPWPTIEGGYLQLKAADGSAYSLTLYASMGWKVEPIIELPTKRDAIVWINDNSYWRSAEDSQCPWIDAFGNPWSDKGVLASARENGGFTVIFEGVDGG